MVPRLSRPRPSLHERADVLDALAALLRSGATISQAIQEWPSVVAPRFAREVGKARRLDVLGFSPDAAAGALRDLLGEEVAAITAVFDLHHETGADPVPLIERLAAAARARSECDVGGRAAVAGAKLSGGIVGGLPLITLPLLPIARAPLFDPAGLFVLVLGSILTTAGIVWMMHLVPRPPTEDDPVAAVADHTAAALRAGIPLERSLDVVTRTAPKPVSVSLRRAARRVALGEAWPDALNAVDPPLFGELGDVLRRADRLGARPAAALDTLAAVRRHAVRQRFERELRRAPVLMVLPLVLCVLPAFGLLAIVPFLRGVALA